MCKDYIRQNLKEIRFEEFIRLFEGNILESFLYNSPSKEYIKRISLKLNPYVCNKELLITLTEKEKDALIKREYESEYRRSLYRLIEIVLMKLDIHPVTYEDKKIVEFDVFKTANLQEKNDEP